MTRSALPIRSLFDQDLSVDEIIALAGAGASQRTSLYLPTHAAGRDVAQDPIRFRGLIKRATEEIEDSAVLDPVRELADDPEFWAHGSAGLGVLADAEGVTVIRLSEEVDELAVVSDRFHLKPLLVALTNATRFEVLALSQHAVRLVGASGSAATELDVPDLPSGMPEALQWDDRERQLQSHAAGRTVGGQVTAGFHGQGGRADSRDADIHRFLQMVDHAVADHRQGSTIPLVLAGVDELVAEYRGVTRCQHVVDGHIPGNPEQLRTDELADRARPLVQPLASDKERRARESHLARTAATVDTVEQAVIAAAAGQVASIFVPADEACWGRYRAGHVVLVEHDVREPGDHDLTDVAATEALLHGGDVFVVPLDGIPGGGTAAATLRY
jgi:hypothetical protein